MDTKTIRFAYAGLTCVLLAACGGSSARPPDITSPPPQTLQPGRKLTLTPESAWANVVKHGESFIYRFPFVACVPAQPGYLLGRFRTTVSLDGKEVSTRYDGTYPVETGGWSIDTEIVVPKDAKPSVYVMEGHLAVRDATVQDRLHFSVVAP